MAAALVVVAMVVSQLVEPGKAEYHAGWYNMLLAALVAVTIVAGRRQIAAMQTTRTRIAALALLAGATIAGFAGIASGLFAPDNQTLVGAPGQRMRVDDLGGALSFPLAEGDATPSVTLERPLHPAIEIGEGARNAGSFILHTTPREVAFVEARDLRGNRLTITQPNGAVFLSPVLLMAQHQTIAGMDLPFDSFSVPAARRLVKAVLLDPAQAATFAPGSRSAGQPAVLFAVDDENDRPLPHAIALSAGGRIVGVGGLLLRASAASYPAVEVVAAPALFAVASGALLAIAGFIGTIAGARGATGRQPPPERS